MVGGPKSHAPEGWYHVVCRGNGGKAVFGRDEDRRRFLGLNQGTQRRARVIGRVDPGAELLARRINVLREPSAVEIGVGMGRWRCR